MDTTKEASGDYWGYLIQKDKTAAPLLEQLCLGLFRIISKDGKGPDEELSPERLSRFYRSVGGNLDSVFLSAQNAGSGSGFSYNPSLSFIYRTLGCFHSLQPSFSAFETPSVPCLTPHGFVRWQTIQLLLCPDEHAAYLQQAVKVYDVLKPDGRTFPKTIPRDAFPTSPDAQMEGWHQKITTKLDDDVRTRNSPYASPMPQPNERPDSYFPNPIPEIRRPGPRSRERDARSRSGASSRRHSLSDTASPTLSPQDRMRPQPGLYSEDRRRSASAQRPGYSPRPRSATTGYTPTSYRRPASSSAHREPYDQFSRPPQRTSPYSRPSPSRRYQPTVDDNSDGEASSEDSGHARRHRSYDDPPRGNYVRRNLLAPVLDMLPGRRRHSSDAGAYDGRDERRRREDSRPRSGRIVSGEPAARSQGVHFRSDVFAEDRASGPDSPTYDPRDTPSGRWSGDSAYESSQAMGRTSSGSGSDRRGRHNSHGQSHTHSQSQSHSHSRRSRDKDVPLRVSTVTGVHGRRYANVEPQHSSHGPAGPSAGLVQQQDPRARYSVAV